MFISAEKFFTGARRVLSTGRGLLTLMLFPPICEVCGREAKKTICEECLMGIEVFPFAYCPQCYKKLTEEEVFRGRPRCHKEEQAILYSPLDFQERTVREIIHTLKYQGGRGHAERLMARIEAGMREELPQIVGKEGVIIPVPMHFVKKIRRGYNQAELFAEKLGKTYGAPIIKQFLKKVRETRPQAELLNREERLMNMVGAISGQEKYKGMIAGKTAIIVDDVYTTGATMRECVKELKKAGAKKVILFSIARSRS